MYCDQVNAMPVEPSILSVEQVNGEALLIKFQDETSLLLTLDEILGLGVPRHPLAEREDVLRESCRKAVRSVKR